MTELSRRAALTGSIAAVAAALGGCILNFSDLQVPPHPVCFRTRYGVLDPSTIDRTTRMLGYVYDTDGNIIWQDVYIPLQLVRCP